MFGDIGWAELLLIGIVALVVIGPEDLPDMFRQLGRFTAKLRQMSREFSRAMEQAAKESGVKDVASNLRAVTNPASLGMSKVKEAADRFEKWDPIKNAAKPSVAKPLVPPPMPATPVIAAPVLPVAHPALTEANAPVGPGTQALLDKKAAKAAILKETAAQLKAVDAGALPAPEPVLKPAVKPRAKAATAAAVAEPVTPKPRTPRKTKKADEA